MNTTTTIIFYLTTFSASALILHLSQKLPNPPKLFLKILALSLPILLATFRHNVGTDFPEYEKIFTNIISDRPAWDHILEPTFYLFSHISNFLTGTSTLLYALYSAIFIISFYTLFTKLLPPKSLPLAFFILLITTFPMSLNIIRQSAAIAIFSLAIPFIITKSPLKYAATIILAATFHFSAIFFLALYPLYRLLAKTSRRLRSPKIPYILLALIAIICIATPLILKLFQNIPLLNHYLYMIDLSQPLYISPRLLANLAILTLVWLLIKNQITKDQTKLLITTLFALGICLQMIGFLMRGGSRISLYLTSLLPIILTYLAAAPIKKSSPTLKLFPKSTPPKLLYPTLAITIALIYFLGICLFDNAGYQIIPYQTI